MLLTHSMTRLLLSRNVVEHAWIGKIHVSTVLAGQCVGIRQVEGQIWQVSLIDYDLRYLDMETVLMDPGSNPFGPKVLTM